jgi:hypothetical protein
MFEREPVADSCEPVRVGTDVTVEVAGTTAAEGAGGAAAQGRNELRVAKRKCLVWILGVSGLCGFLTGVLAEGSAYAMMAEFFEGGFFLIFVVVWCHFDAEERGFVISRALRVMLILLLVAAFPYYLWRTRKWGALLLTLGWAGVFVVLAVLADWAGWKVGAAIYNMVGG